MALREAQAKMAETEEMVHRGPEVLYFDGGEVVTVSPVRSWVRKR